jgi:hypothetical protein
MRSQKAQHWVFAPDKPKKWVHLVVASSSLFFLLWLIPYYDGLPGSSFNLDAPNEKTRVLGMAAIGLFGELHINQVRSMWWCRPIDLSSRKRTLQDGPNAPEKLYYPGKTPGISLTLGPLYGLYKKYISTDKPTLFEATFFARLVGIIIPVWLTSLLFYFLLLRICTSLYIALTGYWVFFLGSMTYSYALTVSSHSLANGMLFAAFVAIMWCPRRIYHRIWISFVGGLCLGVAIGAEYSALFTGVFLGIVALCKRPPSPLYYSHHPLPHTRWRKLLYFSRSRWHLAVMFLGVCLPVAVILWYHKKAFGAYFTTPYAHLVYESFSSAFEQGFMGFQLPPKWDVLFSSMFSPAYGLFFWSPFLVLFLPGAYLWWRYRREQRYLLWILLGLLAWWLFYHSVQFNPRGGWSVGPRYIANIVPFLCLLATWGADQLHLRYGNRIVPLVAVTAIWSIWHYSLASVLFPHIPDHSVLPQIEIVNTMLLRGFTPPNLFQFPPGFAMVMYLLALILLFLYILYAGFRGANRRRAFVMTALLLIFFLLCLYQLPALDYNYRQNRLHFMEGLIPPEFRW